MGFFKKIFKGIGKVFKKIGKGIKKAFKGFGKFMGKIGVVGQIAMMFIPFGQIFAPMLQSLQSTFLGVLGKGLVSANPLIKGASTLVQAAYKTGAAVYEGYKTVTGAVSSFLGETTKFLGSKMGFKVENAAGSFFGKGADSVLGRVGTEAVSNFKGFQEALGGIIDTNPAATGAKYIEQANLMKGDNLPPLQGPEQRPLQGPLRPGESLPSESLNEVYNSVNTVPGPTEKKSLLSKTGEYASNKLAQLPMDMATSLATSALNQEVLAQDPVERQPRKALDFSASFMPDTYGLGIQSPRAFEIPYISFNTDYLSFMTGIMNSLGTPLGNYGNRNMNLSQQIAK